MTTTKLFDLLEQTPPVQILCAIVHKIITSDDAYGFLSQENRTALEHNLRVFESVTAIDYVHINHIQNIVNNRAIVATHTPRDIANNIHRYTHIDSMSYMINNTIHMLAYRRALPPLPLRGHRIYQLPHLQQPPSVPNPTVDGHVVDTHFTTGMDHFADAMANIHGAGRITPTRHIEDVQFTGIRLRPEDFGELEARIGARMVAEIQAHETNVLFRDETDENTPPG